MGRVAGSYGVRGWVKVAPAGGVAQSLAAAREWWIDGEPYAVAAAKLHGASVALERAALTDPGEGHYYLAGLLGLEVRNEQGEVLGTVKQWLSNGAQDVMELVAGSRTRLIPWVSAIVKEVDLGAGRVVVDWSADW